jgi:hypothetical protein
MKKDWGYSQDFKKIKLILSSLRFSKYQFNILLFGGECLMHENIREIVDLCNSNPKVLKTIILTNGVYESSTENLHDMDAEYLFTLHELNEPDYIKFKNNCHKVLNGKGSLRINVMLSESKLFRTRYLELSSQFDIEISQVYDNDIFIVKDLSDMDFLKYSNKLYEYKNKLYNYRDYLKIHRTIVPKNIGMCNIQELNIGLDGSIVNGCNNTNENIFKNPLFFKNYSTEFNCQRDRCIECTGTIRTTKEIL